MIKIAASAFKKLTGLAVAGDFVEMSDEAYREMLEARAKTAPEKPLPGLATRAANLARQSAKEAAAIARGVPAPSAEETARRIAICKSNICGNWRESDGTCALCGCPMAKKAPWRTAKCPAGKWSALH